MLLLDNWSNSYSLNYIIRLKKKNVKEKSQDNGKINGIQIMSLGLKKKMIILTL